MEMKILTETVMNRFNNILNNKNIQRDTLLNSIKHAIMYASSMTETLRSEIASKLQGIFYGQGADSKYVFSSQNNPSISMFSGIDLLSIYLCFNEFLKNKDKIDAAHALFIKEYEESINNDD